MPRRRKQQQPQGVSLSAIVLIALLFFGGRYVYDNWNRFGPSPSPVTPDVVDNDKKVSPKLDGAWLVAVIDRKGVPAEKQLVLDDAEFWNGLTGRGMKGYRILDPTEDKEKADAFIKISKVPPPFVMLIDKSKKAVKTINFPDNDTKQIEAMLK